MKNITVAVPTETWRVARLWCAQNDTTLSEQVSGILYMLPRFDKRLKERKAIHQRELIREKNGYYDARRAPATAKAKTACETVRKPLTAPTISSLPPQPIDCGEL